MKRFSNDKCFYFEVKEKRGLFRIEYFFSNSGSGNLEEYSQICGTNASLFDDVLLAQKEAMRMLTKYEEHPELFKG